MSPGHTIFSRDFPNGVPSHELVREKERLAASGDELRDVLWRVFLLASEENDYSRRLALIRQCCREVLAV